MNIRRMFSNSSMNIRRLLSLMFMLLLNLMAIIYYNHQSKMIPLLGNPSNETDSDKSMHLSSSTALGINNANELELFSNNSLIFVIEKAAENATNETLARSPTGVTEIVLPVSFRFQLNPHHLCSKHIENKMTLLILVCSAIPNSLQRKTIRETWGSGASMNNNSGPVRLAFLLGVSGDTQQQQLVEAESAKFGDIIQQDFVDSYRNLTLKSLMLLQWVTEYCQQVHYVLKTDDDMYVNVPNLVSSLARLPNKSNVIYGTLFRKAKPNRNPKAKWFVPKSQFDGSMFPDYLSGTGYVMSRDVVPKLLEASSAFPFMVMEDVFITGLCASQRRVKRYNVKGFAYWRRNVSGCAFKDAITGHHVTVNDMIKIWQELQKSPLVCPQPKRLHKMSPIKNKSFPKLH